MTGGCQPVQQSGFDAQQCLNITRPGGVMPIKAKHAIERSPMVNGTALSMQLPAAAAPGMQTMGTGGLVRIASQARTHAPCWRKASV